MASARWYAAVLRLGLLLAVWQGPVPWCHCHGTLGSSAAGQFSSLAEHLRSYHASLDPVANVILGWHLHFLPDPSSETSPESADREQHRLPPTSVASALPELLARSAFATVVIDAGLTGPASMLATGIEKHSPRCEHFFAAFAPSLPLPMRLCVARC